MYKWINHDQSALQQGTKYKLDWEGIQYNMIDTTSFMLGNLQSIFLPTKTKKFIENKNTYIRNKHTSLLYVFYNL